MQCNELILFESFEEGREGKEFLPLFEGSHCIYLHAITNLVESFKEDREGKEFLPLFEGSHSVYLRAKSPRMFICMLSPRMWSKELQKESSEVPKIFYVGLLFSLCECNRTPNIWRPPAVFPTATFANNEGETCSAR